MTGKVLVFSSDPAVRRRVSRAVETSGGEAAAFDGEGAAFLYACGHLARLQAAVVDPAMGEAAVRRLLRRLRLLRPDLEVRMLPSGGGEADRREPRQVERRARAPASPGQAGATGNRAADYGDPAIARRPRPPQNGTSGLRSPGLADAVSEIRPGAGSTRSTEVHESHPIHPIHQAGPPMSPDPASPLVLIASHSAHERRLLRRIMEPGVEGLVELHDADHAARELDGAPHRPAVLVIDSGLLMTAHDAQWRQLRSGHPELRIVVRALGSGGAGVRRSEDGAWVVHPGDEAGTLRAVREAAASPAEPAARATG